MRSLNVNTQNFCFLHNSTSQNIHTIFTTGVKNKHQSCRHIFPILFTHAEKTYTVAEYSFDKVDLRNYINLLEYEVLETFLESLLPPQLFLHVFSLKGRNMSLNTQIPSPNSMKRLISFFKKKKIPTPN